MNSVVPSTTFSLPLEFDARCKSPTSGWLAGDLDDCGQGPAIRGSWFSPDGDRQIKTADFDWQGTLRRRPPNISDELRDVACSMRWMDGSRRFAALR